MERVARLRGLQRRSGFGNSLERHGVAPESWEAKLLAKAIGQLRRVTLPNQDICIEFWGAKRCWARKFAPDRWLYYSFDDDSVILWAVHDHIHEM